MANSTGEAFTRRPSESVTTKRSPSRAIPVTIWMKAKLAPKTQAWLYAF
jgi:hypothetical protein